ncbi:MAG: hypothetical protein AB7E47_02240 [Desulfovibrionaceae bacterium]
MKLLRWLKDRHVTVLLVINVLLLALCLGHLMDQKRTVRGLERNMDDIAVQVGAILQRVGR